MSEFDTVLDWALEWVDFIKVDITVGTYKSNLVLAHVLDELLIICAKVRAGHQARHTIALFDKERQIL